MAKVTVVILTHNEECNIKQALDSVCNWAAEVIVVDSLSTDNTEAVVREYGVSLYKNKFVNFSLQRNFAIDSLPKETEWVLFLDADEWLPEPLKNEISDTINRDPAENGFYLNRKLIWMGTWIKRGYFPSWQLRLFRYGFGRCEDRAVNEHFVIDGPVGYLKNTFSDENHNGIHRWIHKHNDYSTREANELISPTSTEANGVSISLFGSQIERRRWLRFRVWNRFPCGLRSVLYFIYRYVFRLGFLDGKMAFYFHFLQALWYPMLIDLKFLESKVRGNKNV